MKRRGVSNLVVFGCFIAMACVDLSAPSGPASISELQLPATFVVRGDVMRDSAGNPAPPAIIAYNQQGDSTTATGAVFFITDSVVRAHIDKTTGIIVGDSFGIAHVLGQIGHLQTAVYELPVTVAPVVIQKQAPLPPNDTLKAPIGADSGSSRGSINIALRVSGGTNAGTTGDTVVRGVRVTYKLLYVPASRSQTPAVFLMDNQGQNLSTMDTTNTSGLAQHQVVVIGSFLAALSDTAFAAGHKTDSVVVQATATYRGGLLRGAPLRIVIPLKSTIVLH